MSERTERRLTDEQRRIVADQVRVNARAMDVLLRHRIEPEVAIARADEDRCIVCGEADGGAEWWLTLGRRPMTVGGIHERCHREEDS